MSPGRRNGPVGESRAVPGSTCGADSSVTELDLPTEHDTRPRCLRCGHPLAVPRSLARAYGPRCWRRTVAGQLEARRDAVGRLLGRVAVRVAVVDAAALLLVSDALLDVLAVLDPEGRTVTGHGGDHFGLGGVRP